MNLTDTLPRSMAVAGRALRVALGITALAGAAFLPAPAYALESDEPAGGGVTGDHSGQGDWTTPPPTPPCPDVLTLSASPHPDCPPEPCPPVPLALKSELVPIPEDCPGEECPDEELVEVSLTGGGHQGDEDCPDTPDCDPEVEQCEPTSDCDPAVETCDDDIPEREPTPRRTPQPVDPPVRAEPTFTG